jgi:hypothetical protein
MNYYPIHETFESGLEIRSVTEIELKNFIDNTDTYEASDFELLHSLYFHETTLGAFLNGILVGVLNYKIINQGINIEILVIDPKKRQIGIAKAFVNFLKNFDVQYITANPFTDDIEEIFIKMGFIVDTEFDPKDTNTVVLPIK